MTINTTYQTERLILRNWHHGDRKPFAQLCADPHVMAYFPAIPTPEACDALVDQLALHIDTYGYGFWAVERKDCGEFIGFVGLKNVDEDLPFYPGVEIGWRLAHSHWGQGFALEAARRSLDIGFSQFSFDEIVSYTTVSNLRSRRVMSRIGMADSQQNFQHKRVPESSKLQEHCLYSISKENWEHSFSMSEPTV